MEANKDMDYLTLKTCDIHIVQLGFLHLTDMTNIRQYLIREKQWNKKNHT